MIILLLAGLVHIFCQEPNDHHRELNPSDLVTSRQYTEDLQKKVGWKVVPHEKNVFKGWKRSEVESLLGAKVIAPLYPVTRVTVSSNLPSAVDWSNSSCNHEVRNQGTCGSCWAFAVSQMLADRCCINSVDHGWLSAQELVSCNSDNLGCTGGWCSTALNYVSQVHGLVPESCYPYMSANDACPTTCKGTTDSFSSAHVCDCVNGYQECFTVDEMKTALKTGPITAVFGVCQSFLSYAGGIYKCDCTSFVGLHAVEVVGYGIDPECNFRVKNTWGSSWGDNGYFNIGCDQCNISNKYRKGNVVCMDVR